MARPDPMLERIEAFNRGRGGVVVRRAANGYSLYSERSGGPVARFKPTGEDDKVRVLAWHREKWGASGPPHHDARPRPGLCRIKPVLLDLRLIQSKIAQSQAQDLGNQPVAPCGPL